MGEREGGHLLTPALREKTGGYESAKYEIIRNIDTPRLMGT